LKKKISSKVSHRPIGPAIRLIHDLSDRVYVWFYLEESKLVLII